MIWRRPPHGHFGIVSGRNFGTLLWLTAPQVWQTSSATAPTPRRVLTLLADRSHDLLSVAVDRAGDAPPTDLAEIVHDPFELFQRGRGGLAVPLNLAVLLSRPVVTVALARVICTTAAPVCRLH
jgi:hypothetical protein